MANVTVYIRDFCPYCTRALGLLKDRGVKPNVINAGADAKKKQEMVSRSNGGRTFPQIFINDQHIGGCDDMMALDRRGGLDPLLSG
ncbi:MAG: glutaredoxin 3 [Pseudomonadota bacterium]